MAEFVRQHGRQAGLIGQHVNQSAAQDDGVAKGEGFQRRGRHDAAMHFRIDVQVVGDFEVVDHRLQNLVHFPARRDQPDALQPVR